MLEARERSAEEELIDAFKTALEIAERILKCERELKGFILGLEGGFIESGASGSIARGKIEILPTGRNFYAIDPTTIPTKAAWKVGVETAEKMIKYYLRKHGRYPESIGHVLWSLDAYRADGEQLAQILHLLGTKPKWGPDGSIKEIDVIPLKELKRPRIDSVIRLSGIIRDTLPNYIHLIDEAVSKVVVLDEPPEWNYVRKHYLENLAKLSEMGIGESGELAKCRIYCAPPGTYGAGVNYAIEASGWKKDEDLAKTWVQWGSYAYTRKLFGKFSPESFILSIKSVDMVTRNHESDEFDIFDCCCFFSYHGGFYNAVKELRGKKDLEIVMVDTKDVSSTEIRGMDEEVERIVRAKLLNPVWISEMKKHGYRGASEFSRKILHLYGWSATTKLVKDWVFDRIAEEYVLNEEMREWFKENNVWALEEIARRLIEAAERRLWKPSKELLEKLRDVYGEIEGILEDFMTGEGEIQGGMINIFNMNEVENWGEKASGVIEAWKKLKEG